MKYFKINNVVAFYKPSFIISIIIYIVFCNICYSQALWEKIVIPQDNYGICLECIQSLVVIDSTLYASVCDDNGMYYSSDLGANWSSLRDIQSLIFGRYDPADQSKKYPYCVKLFSFNDNLKYLCLGIVNRGLNNGMFCESLLLSSNNGENWYMEKIKNDLNIKSILVDGDNIFISDYYYGIFLSRDKGVTWDNIYMFYNTDDGSECKGYTNSLIKLSNKLFVDVYWGYVLSSSDYGLSWNIIFKTPHPRTTSELINMGNTEITVFKSIKSNLYVVAGGQIFMSNDLGNNWVKYSTNQFRGVISDIAIWNDYLIASTYNGIYIYYNSKWFPVGLQGNDINSLTIVRDCLLAKGWSLWKCKLSDIIIPFLH
ncbi:MAG: hypothetical protein NTY74_13645 [Ignavibacteriae bacterium]|nr:hypothetical protein [Ignavibacteriota bacterium]